jgi:hypothetical protein
MMGGATAKRPVPRKIARVMLVLLVMLATMTVPVRSSKPEDCLPVKVVWMCHGGVLPNGEVVPTTIRELTRCHVWYQADHDMIQDMLTAHARLPCPPV